jgi:hypothetical protein
MAESDAYESRRWWISPRPASWLRRCIPAIGACLVLAGCQSPPSASPADKFAASNERHVSMFGNFDLPRKVGTVENAHLQVPVVSPDGRQLLYLRTDQDSLSPMTLLGSACHTPPEGTLSVWIRPTEGFGIGQRLSSGRWAHSPLWSNSGRRVVYVVNEPPGSTIVHLDLDSGQEYRLGVPGVINCWPRFSACDEETVLFSTGGDPNGPFRVARQSVRDPKPTLLTPEGIDCVFPIQSDCTDSLLCARAAGDRLNWARCGPAGLVDLTTGYGTSRRPDLIATWAGIASPLAPGGKDVMFYEPLQDRICIYHASDKRVVRHRTGTIAGCWLSQDAVVLATDQAVFTVNTVTGLSPTLFDGTWIPACYVPAEHRLILLGKETSARFSIVEVVFKPAPKAGAEPVSR